MTTYLQRYQQGEHEAVWADLVALGPAIRDEPVYTEALAVAHAMMTRARHNVVLLTERLQRSGFQFMAPPAWTPPTPEVRATLDAIEAHYGPVPLVLRTWFTVVGDVFFVGAHPRLGRYLTLVPDAQQGPVSDPLMVVHGAVDELEAGEDEYDYDNGPKFVIGIDVASKSHYSGGSDVGFILPAPGFDAPLSADDTWRGVFFMPYLRTCFAWGGFPGLRDQPDAAAAASAELAFLTQDLLPI
jgi:hypothetical protein